MNNFAQRLDDFIWIVGDPSILAPAAIAGALLLLSAMAGYSLHRWRLERAVIEPEIADVVVRIRLYAMLIREEGQSLIASRNRCFLNEAIDRWTALRFQRWTDFQLYLALRHVRRLQRDANRDDREVPHKLVISLRDALRACPGNPRVSFALAVINNGLADLLRMYPAPRLSRPISPPELARLPASGDHDDTAYNLALAHIFDPYALEKTVLSQLEHRTVGYLENLLQSVEFENLQSGFTPRNCSNPLMAEMVLWIIHEERFGPLVTSGVGVTSELRSVVAQLVSQLPDYLRDRPIGIVERPADDQLRVVFEETRLPDGHASGSDFHLGMIVRLGDKFWRADRLEADIAAAQMALIFAPATAAQMRGRKRAARPETAVTEMAGQRLAS